MLNSGNPAQNANIYNLINETNFTLRNGSASGVAGEWIFYIFASNPDTGIKCGAYDGSGTTPQQIDCGFAPQWVMIKVYEGVNQQWAIYDNARMDGSYHTS